MTKDLPDFQSEIVSAAVEASALRSGLDIDKPASPAAGDIWLARDTLILYICAVAGAWTGFDAAQLVQGILTLYANMLGGGYRLTDIADPTAAQDAATRAYVLVQKALCLLLAGGTMSGAIAMGGKKVTGLGAPTAANDAARKTYVDTLHALQLLLTGGTMSGAIAMGNNKITGLAAPTAAADAARKTEVDTVDAKLDDASQGDVTASRAIDGTVYRNTSGKIRIVTVQCVLTKTNAPQYSRVTFCSDANATPTTQIGRIALQPDSDALGGDLIVETSFTFVVLPNHYYKATETHTGTISTLSDWFEWDLH